MLVLAEVTAEQLADVCGEAPGALCEWLLRSTDNEALARAGDFFVARPLKILVIALVAWLINRLVRRGIRRFVAQMQGDRVAQTMKRVKERAPMGLLVTDSTPSLRTAQRAQTIGIVLKSMSSVFIYGIAFIMILGEVGVALGPLIAGAGIVGVALGFGAQSLVKDFLSGIFMLIEDQYGVGDVIDVGDASGQVEALSLRVTRLRDVYGTVWHVPNGEIRRVGNKSQNWARALLDVEVAYEADIDEAAEIIGSTAAAMAADDAWSSQFLEAPEVVGIESLGADGVAIRVMAKVVPLKQWDIQRELRRRIKTALDGASIEIPYPQRTVWVRGEGLGG